SDCSCRPETRSEECAVCSLLGESVVVGRIAREPRLIGGAAVARPVADEPITESQRQCRFISTCHEEKTGPRPLPRRDSHRLRDAVAIRQRPRLPMRSAFCRDKRIHPGHRWNFLQSNSRELQRRQSEKRRICCGCMEKRGRCGTHTYWENFVSQERRYVLRGQSLAALATPASARNAEDYWCGKPPIHLMVAATVVGGTSRSNC